MRPRAGGVADRGHACRCAPQPEHVYNASLVFNPQGRCTARYDKIHLFHFSTGPERYDESLVVQPGLSPCAADIADRGGRRGAWAWGVLRPALSRAVPPVRQAGADVLVVPSAFTSTTGQAHWEVLLRARAIENQCFVLAAAQGGRHDNGRRTWGHSMAISPGARCCSSAPTPGPGLVLAELAACAAAAGASPAARAGTSRAIKEKLLALFCVLNFKA